MKKDDTYRSQFRLPYDLYEKLKAESERNHRSLNAEIVDRLSRSVEGEEAFHEMADRPLSNDELESIRETMLSAFDRLNEQIKKNAPKNKER